MTVTISTIEKIVPKENRDFVFQFFLAVARFEYALKRAGFVKTLDGKADANWDTFASKYKNVFDPAKSDELKQACVYFKAHPPRKQIITAGVLSWSEPDVLGGAPILTWLLGSVRMVRNNLFHGGKFPIAPIEEPARNLTLLRHGLTIIGACVLLDTKVRNHFTTVEE